MAGCAMLGGNALLYYDSSLDYATPTWTVIDEAQDVSYASTSNTGTSAFRGAPYEYDIQAKRKLELTFTLQYLKGSTQFKALADAHAAGTVLQFAAMDGVLPPASGDTATGARFYGQVHDMDNAQPLQDSYTVDVVVRPVCYNDAGTLRHPEYPYEESTP